MLAATAECLIERFGRSSRVDLGDLVVVVPGARAGRRLLEILVDRAESNRLMLWPPKIATVGTLPELLYQAKKPVADDLVQQLVWADVLRKLDRGVLAQVMAERHRLGEVLVEVEGAGDGAGDLGGLQRVGQPRDEVVAGGRDEDLRFVLQPAEGLAVDDAVAVALEVGAGGRGLFWPLAAAALRALRGEGREQPLALLKAMPNRVYRAAVGGRGWLLRHAVRIVAGRWVRGQAGQGKGGGWVG